MAAFALAVPGYAQATGGQVPAAHGTTLTGTAVTLPDALKGKAGVLVMGFSHSSQGQVLNWGRLIEADYGHDSGFGYYEIAMLAGAPKMVRGMIVKSMGKSVPEPERPHFIPLTEDDKPWRTAAHFDKSDDAYVLLLDADGIVRWQTEGDATDASYAELKRRLKELLPGTH